MQVFRKEFPGINHVWHFLPRPDKLFFDYFCQNNRVILEPSLNFRGMLDDKKIPLAIKGYGIPFSIFPAMAMGPLFNVKDFNMPLQEFKITEAHLNKEFTVVADGFRTWIGERIMNQLDGVEFRLKLSNSSEALLTGIPGTTSFVQAQSYFLPEGWRMGYDELRPDFKTLKNLEFSVVIEEGKCPDGLQMPSGDQYFLAPWHKVIRRNGVFNAMMSSVISWYHEWCRLRALNINKDVNINFINIWKRYQDEMSAYEQYFREE